MRIAILDDYQNCITSLEVFNLVSHHSTTILTEYISDINQLASNLNDPEALVLTRTRTHITPQLLDLLPNLKVISQTGKNAGHIDVDACKKRRIAILEGKGNPIATAELTWALIINGLRLIPQAIEGMKKGNWQVNIGKRVYGKKIGIWGYGKIGQRISSYAKAFGATPIIWGSKSSRKLANENGCEVATSKDALFSTCDVISLHLRLHETTTAIVKYDDLIKMQSDSLLVNTARAALIEQGALLKALRNGHPGYAAIDVYDEEPIFDKDYPLLNMPNVICTPHLGYVERAGYEMYFGMAFQNLLDWFAENPESN